MVTPSTAAQPTRLIASVAAWMMIALAGCASITFAAAPDEPKGFRVKIYENYSLMHLSGKYRFAVFIDGKMLFESTPQIAAVQGDGDITGFIAYNNDIERLLGRIYLSGKHTIAVEITEYGDLLNAEPHEGEVRKQFFYTTFVDVVNPLRIVLRRYNSGEPSVKISELVNVRSKNRYLMEYCGELSDGGVVRGDAVEVDFDSSQKHALINNHAYVNDDGRGTVYSVLLDTKVRRPEYTSIVGSLSRRSIRVPTAMGVSMEYHETTLQDSTYFLLNVIEDDEGYFEYANWTLNLGRDNSNHRFRYSTYQQNYSSILYLRGAR